MATIQHEIAPKISVDLVTDLIADQFPEWAHLPIQAVLPGGWDNRTFRLGSDKSVRLPSAAPYAAQVQKEQAWLPKLAGHLSFPIPKPLAMGRPTSNYPWNWSVYRWLDGESANSSGCGVSPDLAADLAKVLIEMHQIDAAGGPLPGAHNFYRGDSPRVYDLEAKSAIEELSGILDADAALSVWERALSTKWNKDPVWIHGDFSTGNILVKDGRLAAVIDFGCMGVGDPACDLVIAWTFLAQESRRVFQSLICLDSDTWARARGWALWKALINLAKLPDKSCQEALENQRVISEILEDHFTE